MAHNKKFEDYMAAQTAVAPVTTSGALTSIPIDATGWDRATFIFTFGTPLATVSSAKLVAGVGVWQATSSGATYARMADASFGALTSGALSNNEHVIDVNVDQSYPSLIISGSVDSSNIPLACVCVLRTPNSAPPTSLSGSIVSPD